MKNQKTLDKLIQKSESSVFDKTKTPSIKKIHDLLLELNVEHTFSESTNVVEHRTRGRRYVNSRYDGKSGYKLEINVKDNERNEIGTYLISMDTSDSYYSCNSIFYCKEIIKLLKLRNKI